MVVLHLQVHRVPGHLFLRAEEEEQQRIHPARPPPRPHAALRVGGLPVSTLAVIEKGLSRVLGQKVVPRFGKLSYRSC